MGQDVRWVVVGYGMGWHHARYLKATAGLSMRGVCDMSPERLAKAGSEHPDVILYSSYDDVLRDSDVDGVVIVTPHSVHAQMAIQGMNAGKHVITDKAMCLSVSEARLMIEARDRNGVLLSTFHNRRWDPDFLTVQKVVGEYQLGRLYHIQSCVTDWGKPGGWRRDRATMGGWLYDWGAHTLDQILLLAGARPVRVFAFSHHRYDDRTTVEDYVNCSVFFESGLTATTVIGYVNMIPMPRWYVLGEFGSLQADGFATPVRVKKLWNDAPQETEVPLLEGDWQLYYQNIADVFAGRAELIVTPEQLVPQIAIAEAAYRSIETGQTVALE